MKSIIHKEDDVNRTKKNAKFKEDVIPWKKEKNKNYKHKKQRKSSTKR